MGEADDSGMRRPKKQSTTKVFTYLGEDRPRNGVGSLVVVISTRHGHAVRSFRFGIGAVVRFGREDADFNIEDRACSRNHFQLMNLDGTCTLRDLESTNGTFVNGERVTVKVLQAEDEIRAGRLVARVRGNLHGAAPQVILQLRGEKGIVGEPPEETDKLDENATSVTKAGARGMGLSAALGTTGGQAALGPTYLPAVWQVCEAAFTDPLGPPEMSRFVEAVRTLGGADRAAILTVDHDDTSMRVAAESVRKGLVPPLPIVPEYAEACTSLGAAISIPDVSVDDKYRQQNRADARPQAGVVYAAVAFLRAEHWVLYVEWHDTTDFAQKFSWACSVASTAGLLAERNVYAAELRDAKEGLEKAIAERTKELVTAVERLSSAQRMMAETGKLATVGELASGIVHELRNPLTAIIGYAHLISTEDREDDRVSVIHQQAMRAQRIVNNLLSLSRRERPERKAVDVRGLVEEAAGLVGHELRRYGVSLRLDMPDETPKVLADPKQLEHVFINLIVNACQAMQGRSKGEILVRARQESGLLHVEVRDDGPGIPERIIPHIFDPFFTTKPSGEGTGLGLAITKSMVESQGGEIRAENDPDGGAVFRFSLPVAPEEVRRAAESPHAAEGGPRRQRVLFVDDEPDIRGFGIRLLQLCNCEAVAAGSYKEALEILQNQDFDVLITDYNMPGGSGADLFEAARAAGKDFTGRVIFISGTTDARSLQELVRAVRGGFLSKPFNAGELVAMVKQLAAPQGT